MSLPVWLHVARKYVGTAEIPGKQHNPTIGRWLRELKAWWTDDETPWCGTYVAAVFRETNIALPTHWYRAKGWLEWGIKLNQPALGCVVVFERTGGGHVGFVVGTNAQGQLLVLGGNQGNKVSVAAFDPGRSIGFRWPVEAIMDAPQPPPRLASNVSLSANEA